MQNIIVVFAVAFAVLLLGPLVGAALYYKTHKGEILHINQNRVRDARYFSKSFSSFIENNLKDVSGNIIKLSKEETFINGKNQKKYASVVEQMIICQKVDFYQPTDVKEFQKEIYCDRNIVLKDGQLELRAAFAKGKMLVGNGVIVGRWIDSTEPMTIYDNCDLGHSASSGTRMSIGENCSFKRLYAPEIRLGQYPWSKGDARDGKDQRIFALPIRYEKEYNIKYISKEMINKEGIVEFSVLSWRNVIVTENVIVQGDVRSHMGVKLSDGAVICGNVFAERDVILGRNACVLGNIFSQGSIHLEEGAAVGQKNRICSMIARNKITFEKNTYMFGYVSCENKGYIVPKTKSDQDKLQNNDKIKPQDMCFLEKEKVIKELDFKDLCEYEHIDQQGFRFQNNWEKVIIPDGATKVPRSMFYHCVNLVEVVLPKSMKIIEDFAFAECKELSNLCGFEIMEIDSIGVSAFENCISLKSIMIPSSVEIIEGAAFSNCVNLEKVEFEQGSKLKKIGEHCFRGCKKLETIRFPKHISEVGLSAFAECESLTSIMIPMGCEKTTGISECDQVIVEVYG
ncbi:MAG: leucine-rich repeat protein [Lachnospiraceae bacterium]|nr:leucine-rich repeat protein [Lachnospiraceae bacterium]